MTNNLFNKINLLKIEDNKNYFNKNSHYFAHYSAAYQIFERNMMFGVGLKNFRKFCNDESLNSEIAPDFHIKSVRHTPTVFILRFFGDRINRIIFDNMFICKIILPGHKNLLKNQKLFFNHK